MRKRIILFSIFLLLITAHAVKGYLDPGNMGGFGCELFLSVDKASAEVGKIISGKATVRVYKPASSERAVATRAVFGDGTSQALGSCSASSDMSEDYTECDFNFIHIYDAPGTYDLTIEGTVDAHYDVDGPVRTITISTTSNPFATSVGPAIESTTTAAILTRVAWIIYWVIGSLFVALVMFGGFVLLTSSGDPQRATKGKQIITYAIIGTAIMALARGIIEFIKLILEV